VQSNDPEEARFPLFDATTTFLVRAAADQPLVLVLDDLHAADMPSLLLLQFLVRELRDAHLLVVGTYRAAEALQTAERAQILSGVARYGHRLPLPGLSESDVARLIAHVAGMAPSHAVVTAVHRITEGNPFFVDEVVRVLVAERAQLPVDLGTGELRVPHGIREVIRERLRPLSAPCQRVLIVAAVIGRECDIGILQAACAVPLDQLLDTLNDAVTRGIIAPVPASLARFSFTHALIRETLYAELPVAERLRLHRCIGEVLEQLSAGNPEPRLAELAHHFYQAAPGGDVQKAIDYATRAGGRAAEQLAYEEAAAHYERGLQALTLAPPDEFRQCELLLALGDVQRAWSSSASKETFQRAADLARGLVRVGTQHAAPLLARAALGFADRGLGMPQLSSDPVVVALLEDALAAMGDADSTLRARLLGRLAMEFFFSDVSERSLVLSQRAVETARRLEDPMTLAYTLSSCA
jgi:predicted ATPase